MRSTKTQINASRTTPFTPTKNRIFFIFSNTCQHPERDLPKNILVLHQQKLKFEGQSINIFGIRTNFQYKNANFFQPYVNFS